MGSQIETGKGRRRESLAARQARVGIVANPRMPDLHHPAPREVWTRWPELRASKRRARAAAGGTCDMPQLATLGAFAETVRRTSPAPDRSLAEEDSAPDASWLRRLSLRVAIGLSVLVAAVYTWRAAWFDP